MNKLIFCLIILLGCLGPAISQKVIGLPATPVPEGIAWGSPERQYISPAINTEVVANVSQPTLAAYLPDASVANGTALVIAPGGGFHFLSINNEGADVAKWCVENGIAAFVLRYRLVPTGEDGVMEFFQKAGERKKMDEEMAPFIALAKADGLAAIEYVRSHAADFGVQPDRIGIMGFSAGGTVAGAAAFEYTSPANRPDFAAPIYPALHVVDASKMPENPMPLFVAVTGDDFFGFQSLCTALYNQWNGARQPIELHIYEQGGHGFGMRKQGLPSDQWIEAFRAWLDSHGWLGN